MQNSSSLPRNLHEKKMCTLNVYSKENVYFKNGPYNSDRKTNRQIRKRARKQTHTDPRRQKYTHTQRHRKEKKKNRQENKQKLEKRG